MELCICEVVSLLGCVVVYLLIYEVVYVFRCIFVYLLSCVVVTLWSCVFVYFGELRSCGVMTLELCIRGVVKLMSCWVV